MSSLPVPTTRLFKVSASLLLATAYFVAAIGIWQVQNARNTLTADSAATTIAASPDRALYRQWHRTTETTLDHYLSTSATPENPALATVDGLFGYVYPSSQPETVPLYRCNTPGGHIESIRSDCEGYSLEGILGYVRQTAATNWVQFYRCIGRTNNRGYVDHISTTDPNCETNYNMEGPLGFISSTPTAPPAAISPPIATIQGPTGLIKNTVGSYKLTGSTASGTLTKLIGYRSNKNEPNKWVEIGSVNCSSATCEGSVNWNTSQESLGEYYVVVNAQNSGGAICSGNVTSGAKDLWGNPLTSLAGATFNDCGITSRLTVTLAAPGLLLLSVVPTIGVVPLEVTAIATPEKGNTAALSWDFGDGALTTGTTATVKHIYQKAGAFPVAVKQGSSTAIQTVTVLAAPTPTLSLIVDPTSGTAPLKVTGVVTGADATKQLSWDFGDGVISQTKGNENVTHTFTNGGSFTITARQDNQQASQKIEVTEPPAAPIAKVVKLASSGGSLPVNLTVATLLAILTTYGLLRRKAV